MGIIVSDDIVRVADAEITGNNWSTIYEKKFVMDHTNLFRSGRKLDNNTGERLLKFDFGAAQSLAAIVLAYCNFDKIQIRGTDTDAEADPGWNNPEYDSGALDLSEWGLIGRYNLYKTLTAFNYRYLDLYVPAGTSEVTTSISVWQVGMVVPLETITELSQSVTEYSRSARLPFEEIQLTRTRKDMVYLAGEREFQALVDLDFGNRDTADESELFTFNRMLSPLVFYRNNSDDSEVMVCKKLTYYKGTVFAPGAVRGNLIQLEENV